MRCPRCDLDHTGSCLRALGRALLTLIWEVRELRAAVDHARAEEARRSAWRTARSRNGL
jgi:hypothetical protein